MSTLWLILPLHSFPNMSSTDHKKVRERIALAVRIEKANRPAQTCSYCQQQCRKCFLDLDEGTRCSECVRAKRPCDSAGYVVVKPPAAVVPGKLVCRFFCPRRRSARLATPPPEPVVSVSPDWLPWLPDPSDPMANFDPNDPFWVDLFAGGGPVSLGSPGFLTGIAEVNQDSSDSSWVPMSFPHFHTLSISLSIPADPVS